jgi:hypothetical protein
MANLPIHDEQMRLLKEYEAKTGVPINRCVDEAVSNWLICVAPVRLVELGQEPLTLGDHLKTGHLWSVQNRPLEQVQT